jgi:hypothetical protein
MIRMQIARTVVRTVKGVPASGKASPIIIPVVAINDRPTNG